VASALPEVASCHATQHVQSGAATAARRFSGMLAIIARMSFSMLIDAACMMQKLVMLVNCSLAEPPSRCAPNAEDVQSLQFSLHLLRNGPANACSLVARWGTPTCMHPTAEHEVDCASCILRGAECADASDL